MDDQHIQPPSRLFFMLEARAMAELATSVLASPFLLGRLPRGDGHPVMVLPGFLAGDISTAPLRAILRRLGYATRPWGFGRNLGPSSHLEEKIVQRVRYLASVYNEKLSLVGWSLGGIYAREVARETPDSVRGVISLGSPFGHPKANHAWPLFEAASGLEVEQMARERMEILRTPPPVPTTSIYSKTDGIVNWRSCLQETGPRSENIEVEGSHCGMGFNPLVIAAIADRLAQAEGAWRPFERDGWRRMLYRQGEATAV